MNLAEPTNERLVEFGVAEGSWHDGDVRRRDLVESRRCDQTSATGVILNVSPVRRDEHDVMSRYVGEHLKRADNVEERELRIQGERDLHSGPS